jgi:6-phosphogluconate dehydrogenase (decarboxylating)
MLLTVENKLSVLGRDKRLRPIIFLILVSDKSSQKNNSTSKKELTEYSVNLAPHQSNWINYPNSGATNVNVSHIGDPLSGNDAIGNVINTAYKNYDASRTNGDRSNVTP